MTRKVTPTIRSPSLIRTEHFKRPDHPDFMDANELKKRQWSGIRKNQMSLQWEFWILGKIEKEVSFQQTHDDPDALKKTHIELFQMSPEPHTFKR